MAYGVSHRLQRSFPDRAITYGKYVIPPNTPVSMTSVLIHENPEIYPEPRKFNPERWLLRSPDNDKLSSDAQLHMNTHLLKYLVTFSRGTRACVGMNLAYAELYLTLANVFRKFELELYETTRERDIDVVHDFFNPSPRLDSVGLRVRVVGGAKA